MPSNNVRHQPRTRRLKHFGRIPAHWDDAKVGDIFEVQLGKMLSQESKTGKSYKPYLGNWNVQWGRFDLSRVEQMDFDASELEKFRLLPGDLLVCEGGEVGRTAIWTGEIEDCCYQKALHRLRPRDGRVLPEFFKYYMEEATRQQLFKRYTTETSIAHLTRETLIEVVIPLPSIGEQHLIVDVLASVDESIEATRAVIDQTCRTKAALVDRFILKGQPKRRTHFKRFHLGMLFEERKESGRAKLPTLSVTMNGGLVDRESLDRRVLSDLAPEQHLLVRKGDIAYNMMRMWQGVFGLALHDGIVSPAYVVLKPRPEIDPHYAYYLFSHPASIRKFERFSQGLTGDRLRLYFDHFSAIPVEIPNLTIQRTCAATLRSVDERIESEESTLASLQTLKVALCPEHPPPSGRSGSPCTCST